MNNSLGASKRRLSGSPKINKVSLFGRVKATISQHIHHLVHNFMELWNTPFATLMTILVLGLALSLPTVFHVVYKNVDRVGGQWESASEISL
ncbi:MAG: permease-like cell division protein FtsX, partial [Psychromonas sp.]